MRERWTRFCTVFQLYGQPRVRGMLVLGFSSGLPLLLVLGTLSFWLREAGINRAAIGHVSWVALAYGLKWLWAPLLDHLRLPGLTHWLGRRRAWLLLTQIFIAAGLLGMAHTDPVLDLPRMVHWAMWVAFFSATQDIALDAWRIEAVDLSLQGVMAAAYQAGYRLGMIVAGAGALGVAAWWTGSQSGYALLPWQHAYLLMACLMGIGVLATFWVGEPAHTKKIVTNLPGYPAIRPWLVSTFIAPFADFFRRYGWQALLILGLIAVYRISDVVMGVMSNTFYVDMGYTKAEVATVSKVYGVLMGLLGAGLGGVLVARWGMMRVLLLGAVLSLFGNLLFVWLSGQGHNVPDLIWTVSADNLAGGVAASAFVTYLSSLTNVAYSASQYALLSSVMLLLPKFLAGFSGQFVDAYGYGLFFSATAAMSLPVIVLVLWVMRAKIGVAGTQKIEHPCVSEIGSDD